MDRQYPSELFNLANRFSPGVKKIRKQMGARSTYPIRMINKFAKVWEGGKLRVYPHFYDGTAAVNNGVSFRGKVIAILDDSRRPPNKDVVKKFVEDFNVFVKKKYPEVSVDIVRNAIDAGAFQDLLIIYTPST